MFRSLSLVIFTLAIMMISVSSAALAADPSISTRTEVDASGAFKTMGAVIKGRVVYDFVAHLNPGWMEFDLGYIRKSGDRVTVIPMIGIDGSQVGNRFQLGKVYAQLYFFYHGPNSRVEQWLIFGTTVDGSRQQMVQVKEIMSHRLVGDYSIGVQFDDSFVSRGGPTILRLGPVLEQKFTNGSIVTLAYQLGLYGDSRTSVVAQIN